MQIFQKPENALRRARELQNVGQQGDALKVLNVAIGHRRFRTQGWDEMQEDIMMSYVHLCVDQRKLQLAREGLHQYRTFSQQCNHKSLGKVLCEFRDLAEKRMKDAKAKLEANELAEGLAGDLEAAESPESLMLSTLQIEVRDEASRDMHSVLRFVWDTYKTILDIIRTTPKVEETYHETAQKALMFCRNNQRPQEFKRLCELMRNHYMMAQRLKAKPEYDQLLRPDLHLETRMVQLQVASDLLLWRECFNTAEDIHSLGLNELFIKSFKMNSDLFANWKKNAKESLTKWTIAYYEKLSKILWVSDDYLFHALAWLKYLLHVRNMMKTVREDEIQSMCSTAVLAVLCIPLNVGDSHEKRSDITPEMGTIVLEHQKKMSVLLNHSSIPSRESLKQALVMKDILSKSSVEVQKLYNLLENETIPLKLCTQCQPLLEALTEEPLSQYLVPLKKVIFLKLILQLSKVYTSVTVDYFTTHICPKEFLPWREAEKVVVGLVLQGDVQMRLDYVVNAIYFGSSTIDPAAALWAQLAWVGKQLEKAAQMCYPKYHAASQQVRQRFLETFTSRQAEECERIKQRNKENDQRRLEMQEEQAKAAEERRRKIEAQRLLEETQERIRREEAIRFREEQRLKEEKHKMKSETAQQMLEEIKKIGGGKMTKITIKGKQLDEININDVLEGNVDYVDLEKAQEEHRVMERADRIRQRKLEWRKMDYAIRAFREEEVPLLVNWKAETLGHDTAILLELQSKHEEEHKAAFQEALSEKQIFECVIGDKQKWVEERMNARRLEYTEKQSAQRKRLVDLLKSRKIERAKEKRDAELKRQQLEAEAKKKEEEEKRVLAEKEKKRLEEEAHKRKLDESFEKQRRKDMEIEERLKAKSTPSAAADDNPFEGDAESRRRPKEKEMDWRRGDSGAREDDNPRKRGDLEREPRDRGTFMRDRGERGQDRESKGGVFGRERGERGQDRDMREQRGGGAFGRERGQDRDSNAGMFGRERGQDRDMREQRGGGAFGRERGQDREITRSRDDNDRAASVTREELDDTSNRASDKLKMMGHDGSGAARHNDGRSENGNLHDTAAEANGVDPEGFVTIKKKGRK